MLEVPFTHTYVELMLGHLAIKETNPPHSVQPLSWAHNSEGRAGLCGKLAYKQHCCDYEISFHAILWHIEKVWNAFMRNLSPALTWHDPILGRPGRLHWSTSMGPGWLGHEFHSCHRPSHAPVSRRGPAALCLGTGHAEMREDTKKNWMDDRSIGSMAIWMLYLCINYV